MGDSFFLVSIVLLITVSSSTQDMGQLNLSPENQLAIVIHLMKELRLCKASLIEKSNSNEQLIESQKAQIKTLTDSLDQKDEYITNITSIKEMTRQLELYKEKIFQKIGSKWYYIDKEGKLDWVDAKIKCLKMGADLIDLESQQELNNISRFLDKSKGYWINVKRSNTNEWISRTTDRQASFLKWHERQPNNYGDNENCVHLISSHGEPFLMNYLLHYTYFNTIYEEIYFICTW